MFYQHRTNPWDLTCHKYSSYSLKKVAAKHKKMNAVQNETLASPVLEFIRLDTIRIFGADHQSQISEYKQTDHNLIT